ncbi:uncharacterized protein LOC110025052 [Phalaenopsis equestris]|uniref:uncharacterized protein LOC110025052 n=1 Tax=Phalaenopsis equestris TaxID=78828 RepID=UPI0009E5B5AE|nr:uncharacterized protein LOC110025052 [Phalaenopsis equestris]
MQSLNFRLFRFSVSKFRPFSSSKGRSTQPAKPTGSFGEEEWNDAWETAWLPDDLSARDRAPWETDVNFPYSSPTISAGEIDADTKAFVAEMDDRWSERRAAKKQQQEEGRHFVELVEGKERKIELGDYRVRKQRIHSGLWMKEIEKMEESKLGGSNDGDDIDRLLDSCAEIFDAGNINLNNSKIPSTSEFKTKPDGWESTTKAQDGSIWDISQREEDILLQEFERRMAFNKFQIASFIKTHIFSRRRPIDGWKYMIEVIGPNARRGKGSVQRLPGLTDSSTLPFQEEKPLLGNNSTYFTNR